MKHMECKECLDKGIERLSYPPRCYYSMPNFQPIYGQSFHLSIYGYACDYGHVWSIAVKHEIPQ